MYRRKKLWGVDVSDGQKLRSFEMRRTNVTLLSKSNKRILLTSTSQTNDCGRGNFSLGRGEVRFIGYLNFKPFVRSHIRSRNIRMLGSISTLTSLFLDLGFQVGRLGFR
jgi:hypothetical protein